jgi:hypothetical protein
MRETTVATALIADGNQYEIWGNGSGRQIARCNSPDVEAEVERKMENKTFRVATLVRHQLEETWRLRVEQALQQYRAATMEYRRLLQEEPDGRFPCPDGALARVRQVESDALIEYSRSLKMFSDLTIHGEPPEETTRGASKAALDL